MKEKAKQILERLKHWSQQINPPGFEGINLWDLLRFFFDGITKGAITTRASAISFKIILALAPTIILLFTLIPYIPIDNFQENLFGLIKTSLPEDAFSTIEELILDLINNKFTTFLSISFLLGIYYASNSMHALLQGLKESYHLDKKQNPFKQRLYSIVLLLTLPLFLGTAFLIEALSSHVFDALHKQGWIGDGLQSFAFGSARLLIMIVLLLLAISTLYNLANEKRNKWRVFSAGSWFATLLILLTIKGFAYYVNTFGQFNKFYGSLGTVVILLLWIYSINVVLIIGFDINMTLTKAKNYGKSQILL
jgi:membrane protein